MDEHRTDYCEDDSGDDVHNPVYPEVLDREEVYHQIKLDEEVELPVPPFSDADPKFPHVQTVDDQKPDRQSEVKGRDAIVHRIVVRDELEVPAVVV